MHRWTTYYAFVGLCLAPAILVVGCASKSKASQPNHNVIADAGTTVDAGPTPATYPAFKPDVGQLVKGTGVTIASPKIVTVTWTADTNEAALEDFGDKLGASSYWQ